MVLVIAVFGIIFMMITGGWLYRRNKRERKRSTAVDL
jgi:LPXTG-motif cell wall-anchored protein